MSYKKRKVFLPIILVWHDKMLPLRRHLMMSILDTITVQQSCLFLENYTIHKYPLYNSNNIWLGADLYFRKWRGHNQIGDVGIAGMCTVLVCETHGHAKHATLGGSGGMPSRQYWKFTLCKIESLRAFLVIDYTLMLLWTQVQLYIYKTS